LKTGQLARQAVTSPFARRGGAGAVVIFVNVGKLSAACVMEVWNSSVTARAASAANVSLLVVFIGSVFLFLLTTEKGGLQTEFQFRHADLPL
jgi:hypothetical protein